MLLYLKEHDLWANGERLDVSLTRFSTTQLSTEDWRYTINRVFIYFIALYRSGVTVA